MSEWIQGRGDFFYKVKGDVVVIELGNPEEFEGESEYVLAIHKLYLPCLIATLRLLQS